MHPTSTERLTLTVEEACRLLGVGRTVGYELARRGELPGVIRLGRRFVVSRPALEKALGITQPFLADPSKKTGAS
jgi:excisionase family DNA binding protein